MEYLIASNLIPRYRPTSVSSVVVVVPLSPPEMYLLSTIVNICIVKLLILMCQIY